MTLSARPSLLTSSSQVATDISSWVKHDDVSNVSFTVAAAQREVTILR